jgi:elongation factor 1-gamma
MAPTHILHSTKENKNTYKALIAAKYAGASVELTSGFEFGKSNKTPEFLKMNPNGKVCPEYCNTYNHLISPNIIALHGMLSPSTAPHYNIITRLLMQVPTLETPQGGLWESNAIARYIARLSDNGLFGMTPFETVRLSGAKCFMVYPHVRDDVVNEMGAT